ncbi:hypothetical protein E4U57_002504 [Claviceps arundinis]|uniref:Uncharacterized protein n=1 Tax=Claviceps arundinis TaxID=1623583 RepID=A0A9P7SKW2_9HYPO|nr:hypothetical protein E4U56_004993 [Claviceps arundinis]KAG5966440.1 hypothetical protein E4U57_002504 [Claviceps arundinis]
MNAIVKRLDSVQNLGAMTVLSSDKGSNGNNIDGAIIEHRMTDGRSISTTQYEKAAAIPFNFERRRSACIVKGATRTNLLIVRGAFDEVLRPCSRVRQDGVTVPLDFQKKQMLVTRTNRLNRKGFRVLLVSEKDIGEGKLSDENSLQELEINMIFEEYGLEEILSIIDPLKDDAAQSIVELKNLGVQTEVLTGDTLPVAVNMCQRLELVSRYVTENDDVRPFITGTGLTKRPPSRAIFASQATV